MQGLTKSPSTPAQVDDDLESQALRAGKAVFHFSLHVPDKVRIMSSLFM